MNWLCKPGDDRLFTPMHTLLYPGVLGSLIYAFPDNIEASAAYSNGTYPHLARALNIRA